MVHVTWRVTCAVGKYFSLALQELFAPLSTCDTLGISSQAHPEGKRAFFVPRYAFLNKVLLNTSAVSSMNFGIDTHFCKIIFRVNWCVSKYATWIRTFLAFQSHLFLSFFFLLQLPGRPHSGVLSMGGSRREGVAGRGAGEDRRHGQGMESGR